MIILVITAMLTIGFSFTMLYKDNPGLNPAVRLILTLGLVVGSLVLGLLFFSQAQASIKPSMEIDSEVAIYTDVRVTGYITQSVDKQFSLAVFCLRKQQALATLLISKNSLYTDFVQKGGLISTMLMSQYSNIVLPWLRIDASTLVRQQIPGYPLAELEILKTNKRITVLYSTKVIRFSLEKAKKSIARVELACGLRPV